MAGLLHLIFSLHLLQSLKAQVQSMDGGVIQVNMEPRELRVLPGLMMCGLKGSPSTTLSLKLRGQQFVHKLQ